MEEGSKRERNDDRQKRPQSRGRDFHEQFPSVRELSLSTFFDQFQSFRYREKGNEVEKCVARYSAFVSSRAKSITEKKDDLFGTALFFVDFSSGILGCF